MSNGTATCVFLPSTPDFYPSRIAHLGFRIQQQQQKRRGEKSVVLPFFVVTNFTKLKIILFLNRYRTEKN
jgi:hypothetical protein